MARSAQELIVDCVRMRTTTSSYCCAAAIGEDAYRECKLRAWRKRSSTFAIWTTALVELTSDFQVLRTNLLCALADNARLAERQAARQAFSPGLAYGRHFGPPPPTARQAAVVAMIEPRDGTWTIPVTVRPDYLHDHPGQVSLPGGRLEAGESHQQAAEREFIEELGCQLAPGQIIGELLPLYVFRSDYYVRSFVAISDRALHYTPCLCEVARVVHVPLAAIALASNVPPQVFSRDGVFWTAPAIRIDDTTIWGATAMILAELPVLLGTQWTGVSES